jgi:hypothetical protein
MTFFLPLLLILLVGILVKNFLPTIFRAAGCHNGGALVLEDRLGGILFLSCSAIMAVVAFWYPWYLCVYHAAPDDRYGFALLFAFPFYLFGAAVAGMALFRLLRSVIGGSCTVSNGVYAFCGVLLAFIGFSPLIMFAWRIISR